MTARAAIHARVSTSEQLEGTSLDDQVSKGRAYAEAQGWSVSEVFVDEGVSGAKALAERPAGSRLLAAAQAGDFERVIFAKLDRFTRNVRHGLADFEALEAAGAGLVFIADSVDTSTPSGRMFRTLLVAFAEFERERIAERMLDGRRAIAERSIDPETGRSTAWPGGSLPRGWTSEAGTIVEDPEHASNVRRLFELRGLGQSTTEVARKMNAEGRRTRPRKGTPGLYSDDIVAKVLRDADRYVEGRTERKIGGKVYTFAAPPLIDRATAARAADYCPTKDIEGRGERRYSYALAGRIFHEHEDGELLAMWGRKRAGLRWHRCAGSIPRAGFETSCGGASGEGFGEVNSQMMTAVQADYVEAVVARWLVDFVRSDEAVEAALRDAREASVGKDIAEDPEALRDALRASERKLGRIAENYAEGLISADEKGEQVAAIRRDTEAIAERLAELDRRADLTSTFEAEVEALRVEKGLNRMRNEATAVLDHMLADRYGRAGKIPERTSERVGRWAQALGLVVVLTRNDDPRRPKVTAFLDPLSLARFSSC